MRPSTALLTFCPLPKSWLRPWPPLAMPPSVRPPHSLKTSNACLIVHVTHWLVCFVSSLHAKNFMYNLRTALRSVFCTWRDRPRAVYHLSRVSELRSGRAGLKPRKLVSFHFNKLFCSSVQSECLCYVVGRIK